MAGGTRQHACGSVPRGLAAVNDALIDVVVHFLVMRYHPSEFAHQILDLSNEWAEQCVPALEGIVGVCSTGK